MALWVINDPLALLTATREGGRSGLLLGFFVLSVVFFRGDGDINCLVVLGILACGHHSLKLCIETTHKTGLFLSVSIHVFHGILRKVIEFGHVFHHTFVALLQGEEFFRFHSHKPFWNIMGVKRVLEFRPGDLVSWILDSKEIFPLGPRCSPKLLGCDERLLSL